MRAVIAAVAYFGKQNWLAELPREYTDVGIVYVVPVIFQIRHGAVAAKLVVRGDADIVECAPETDVRHFALKRAAAPVGVVEDFAGIDAAHRLNHARPSLRVIGIPR